MAAYRACSLLKLRRMNTTAAKLRVHKLSGAWQTSPCYSPAAYRLSHTDARHLGRVGYAGLGHSGCSRRTYMVELKPRPGVVCQGGGMVPHCLFTCHAACTTSGNLVYGVNAHTIAKRSQYQRRHTAWLSTDSEAMSKARLLRPD